MTNLKTGKVKERVVYGFTSLARDKVAPDELLVLIRSYWGIEMGYIIEEMSLYSKTALA